MLRNTIYNIYSNLKEIAVFLGIILFLGMLIYILTAKLDIHKKRMKYLGLLTGFNTYQVLLLSTIIIRLFCIIYSACTYTEQILIELAIIFVIEIIYIILKPKKIMFESINTLLQVVLLYLTNVLRTYQIQVSDEMYVGQVVIVLIAFIILCSTYFFLKGFEDLIISKKSKCSKTI